MYHLEFKITNQTGRQADNIVLTILFIKDVGVTIWWVNEVTWDARSSAIFYKKYQEFKFSVNIWYFILLTYVDSIERS